MKHPLRILAVVAVILFSAAGTARAQRLYSGFVGPHELSGNMGFSVGLSDWTPGGFKLDNEYGYRLGPVTWFNVQLNFALGGGGPNYYDGRYGQCWDPHTHSYYVCDVHWNRWSGDAIEMIAGVKLKFPRGRLLPYAKLGGGLVFSFLPGDLTGVAVIFRGGGGVKYYVIPNLAVGGELNIGGGPNFINHDAGTHAYAAIDVLGGVEFNF
jgi:hypothetical protein